VQRSNDPELVAREYETTERLAQRRLDRTAWLRGEREPWLLGLQAIAEFRPRRVLDAGCGNADFASLIAAPEVVCVDSSEAAVEAARRRGLEARVADIQELPFTDGEFDLVTCNWVLYHLPEVDAGLAEIVRVLRPGGRFVGMYNCRTHLGELSNAIGNPFEQPTFACEDGPGHLGRHFGSVERRDAVTEASWETRADLQRYLDAFSEMADRPLVAPDGPYPFRAIRRNCVLVAEKHA
jgi:SAM-dependent methyltransferase